MKPRTELGKLIQEHADAGLGIAMLFNDMHSDRVKRNELFIKLSNKQDACLQKIVDMVHDLTTHQHSD